MTHLTTDTYYLYEVDSCGLRRTSLATGATSPFLRPAEEKRVDAHAVPD